MKMTIVFLFCTKAEEFETEVADCFTLIG